MTELLLSEVFPPRKGGSGRWFWELYRRLPRERYALAVGSEPRQAEFDAAHDLRLQRVPLSWGDYGLLSWRAWRGYVTAYRQLRHIIRTEGVTRLHCGRAVPEGWLGWLIKKTMGLPYICYVHGEEVNLRTQGTGAGLMASRQYRWLTKKVLIGADRIIANSRSSQRILLEDWQLSPDKVCLLHPGVDAQHFVPVPRDQAVRASLGWHNRPVLLTVGRLQKRKGQDQLILALKQLRTHVPDVLYAIVGEGEEQQALHELVQREQLTEHVQFRGESDERELLQCYQQCDIFALPNRQIGSDIEGFGMVLVEAQACGKPVIAGTSGGTAETMRIPETGTVVSCDGPDELARTLSTWLLDHELRARMGLAAREWVVEHLDWAALTKQAQSIFAPSLSSSLRSADAAQLVRS